VEERSPVFGFSGTQAVSSPVLAKNIHLDKKSKKIENLGSKKVRTHHKLKNKK
jgi:hypothetical protein